MASLSLYPQFESNLISNRNVIDLLLQLKSEKAHGKNCIKVKAHLVHHLCRNRLLFLITFKAGCINKGISDKKLHEKCIFTNTCYVNQYFIYYGFWRRP